MQMEESDQLEQQVFQRQPRAGAFRSRGTEQIVREIPASSLGIENPASPVRVRFSLGASADQVDVTPKSRSKRERRRSAAEVKVESDEELIVDEPMAVISSVPGEQSLVMRMKLNMDRSRVPSFGVMETSHHHSVCYFINLVVFSRPY